MAAAARSPLAFVARYAGLFGTQLRMSSLAAMQYRVDFVTRGLVAFLWSALTLIPLLVVFRVREEVADRRPSRTCRLVEVDDAFLRADQHGERGRELRHGSPAQRHVALSA